MTRIAVIVQRDILGDVAGFVVALDVDGDRRPVEELGWLSEASGRARELMTDHAAQAIYIDDEANP